MTESEREPNRSPDEEGSDSPTRPSLNERLMGQAPQSGQPTDMARSNLADRLMSQTSDGVPVATAKPELEHNTNSALTAGSLPRFEPATGTNPDNRTSPGRAIAANVGVTPAMLDNSFNQARRFIFRFRSQLRCDCGVEEWQDCVQFEGRRWRPVS